MWIYFRQTRTNYAKDIVALLNEAYGQKVRIIPNSIPISVRVAESSAEKLCVFTYDPKGKASKAYDKLVIKVLENEVKQCKYKYYSTAFYGLNRYPVINF